METEVKRKTNSSDEKYLLIKIMHFQPSKLARVNAGKIMSFYEFVHVHECVCETTYLLHFYSSTI